MRLQHKLPFAILMAVCTLLFLPLLLSPGGVLYSDHSDMLAMHLPMKWFSVSWFQSTGELPLWCPYSFAGMPFVHDVQVAAFYPLHAPLYYLQPEHVGTFMSWLVAFHVLLAGWSMFGYARLTGLTRTGATAAAIGWMLAGKWLLHVLEGGHYIFAPLAWLPLVLIALHKSVAHERSFNERVLWTACGGIVFGLLTLGAHPQITFYCGLCVALSLLLPSTLKFVRGEDRSSAVRSLGVATMCGVACVVIAVGLSAVQLLPAIEATPHTSRSLGVDSSDALPGGARALISFVGPAIVVTDPAGYWEDRGGFTVIALLLAAIAIVSRRDEQTRNHIWLAGLLVVFSLGGAALLQWLPGFRLFRQSTRMLLLAAFPIAWLAGAGVERLSMVVKADEERIRWVITRVLAAVVILCGGLAIRTVVSGDELVLHPYWFSLAITVPGFLIVINRSRKIAPTMLGVALVALLTADHLALCIPQVRARPMSEIYPVGAIAQYLIDNVQPGERVLTRDESEEMLTAPLGTGSPLALLHNLEAVRGYNSFDVAAYRDYLRKISGDPNPLKPFEDLWTFPLIGNFPLHDRAMVNRLGVRYLAQPVEVEPPIGWELTGVVEDRPVAYNLIDGGVREMPAYALYRNPEALPRAFVLPEDSVRRDDLGLKFDHWERASVAEMTEFTPNRIGIALPPGAAGYLVLTDAAYPGWQSRVDGTPTEWLIANDFFRAIEIKPGSKTIEFQFDPKSLRFGRAITTSTALLLTLAGCLAGFGQIVGKVAASTAGRLRERPSAVVEN